MEYLNISVESILVLVMAKITYQHSFFFLCQQMLASYCYIHKHTVTILWGLALLHEIMKYGSVSASFVPYDIA